MKAGADVFAQCRRCGEVWHVVVAIVPGRKTRVECKQCSGRHGYTPPASELPPPGMRKTTPAPRATRKKDAVPTIAADPSRPVRSYDQGDQYETGDRIVHPSFGEGVVQSIPGPKKICILFSTGERTLAQRRGA